MAQNGLYRKLVDAQSISSMHSGNEEITLDSASRVHPETVAIINDKEDLADIDLPEAGTKEKIDGSEKSADPEAETKYTNFQLIRKV
jgi:hypothetical protein